MLNIWLTGADFCLGCVIGKGLIIRHSNGIVVGGLSVIGENCTLLQQVTLGERDGDGSDHNHSNPIVGNGVTISAGAKLIGGIVVGDNAIIGANDRSSRRASEYRRSRHSRKNHCQKIRYAKR